VALLACQSGAQGLVPLCLVQLPHEHRYVICFFLYIPLLTLFIQALPISTSPRSLFTLMTDSDSDDAPPTRDNHNSPPSDAALVLNVHGGLDTSSRLHHRFKRVEVPYPRSYERGILDL